MAQDCSNFEKNGTKWTFRRSIEVAKRGSNCKLTLGDDDQLPELNRRSYNEHMGSETFINLLDGERGIGAAESRKENIKSLSVVSNVLHSGGEELHTNEEHCFCVPSRYLIHKGGKSLCLKSSLGGHVSMDVVSQSEFASQTLKAFSTQNLEWIAVEERAEIRNGHTKYKLKESTPGCLPSKRKSKKLQRKMNGMRLNPEELTDGTRTDPNCNETRDLTGSVENDYEGPSKATRSKSFLSSLKFIKLGKFGRKKKRKGDLCEACDHSNWDTESAESSEERKGDSDKPYQDDEFVFGGVRVFIGENGECYEIDEELETTVSSNSSFSDDESHCSNGVNCARRKFESRDSLNFGYSGSFVT